MSKNSEIVVDDLVLNGVMSVVKKGVVWTGTMTDLNKALVSKLSKNEVKSLPGSPSALRIVLNRVVNRLRNKKVSVRFMRSSDYNRTRLVRFLAR